MKNRVEGIESRLGEAEDRISDVEDKIEKNTLRGKKKDQNDLKRMRMV